MVYLYQHKTVDEYLFLVLKFIRFNLLYFFPYSVKEGEDNKSGFPPLFHNIYRESEKKDSRNSSLLGKATRVSSVIHSGTRHRSQYYMHFPSIQTGIPQLAESSAIFRRGRDLTTVKIWYQINIKANTNSTDLAQQIYLNKHKTTPNIYTSSAY